MTNYFRTPDSLVDAVLAVLSGQPVVEKKMDPVDQKALKGKHSERKDKDIDNDGDVDSSDEYLHKRRQAISKAKEKDAKKQAASNESKEEDDDYNEKTQKKKLSNKRDEINLKPTTSNSLRAVSEEEMSDKQKKKREEIVKSMKKKMPAFKKKYGDRAQDVMYATATKMALKEGFELNNEQYKYISEVSRPPKYGSFVKLKTVMQKIKDGEWEAMTDVKPGRALEISHVDTKKRVMIQVESADLDKVVDTTPSFSKDEMMEAKKNINDLKAEYRKLTGKTPPAGTSIQTMIIMIDQARKDLQDKNKKINEEGNGLHLDEISSAALKRYADEVEKSMPRKDDGRYKPITDPKLIQRWRLRNNALDKAAKKRWVGTQARESDNFTEDNLDEVSDKKLDAYRQKAFQDQPAGDDGSDKYRKRKTGRDLAFDKQTGRAKVRATTEPTSMQIKQAIGIARDKRYRDGNMTGATKVMDKIHPGLQKHPLIRKELQKQNETVAEARTGRPRKDGTSSDNIEGIENIQMQLRKSISLNGQKDVEFTNGEKVKIAAAAARKVLSKINSIQRPQEKQNAVNYIMKSAKNLNAFAAGKEGDMDPDADRKRILSLK
jgi:hypothetical protein